jgi:two-component system cell cycle response regulator DivK
MHMSRRILVVEDREDNRRILRDLLTSSGYDVIYAENGEEALIGAGRERPNLILMDIQLPLLDGYETTRRLKADPALRGIPVIAVTSYPAEADATTLVQNLLHGPLWAASAGHSAECV